MFEATVLAVVAALNSGLPRPADDPGQVAHLAYFPPPESKSGWRKLDNREAIRRQAGMDPDKLTGLRDWLLNSDQRDFAAVVEYEDYLRRAVAAVLVDQKSVPATKAKMTTPAEEYQAVLKEYEEASRGFRKAETDVERNSAIEGVGRFPRRFLELADKNPKDPIALEALTQAVRVLNSVDSLTLTAWEMNKTASPIESKDNSAGKVVELLLRDHIRSDKLGLVCERMRYGIRKEYETFLRKVLQASPRENVQGLACLSLAEFLKNHLQKFDLIQERPEFAGRYQRLLGKEYFEDLQRKGNANLTSEIETVLEQAATKYADVKLPYGGSVGEQAKTELFEIRHLAIGREASDIGGEDQDGKQFKLSDYRGKVVLLYFWSEY